MKMYEQISDDFNKHGGSYLLSNNAYEDYVQGWDAIGRPDGQFMIPSNQMDDLLKNHPNDPREWERQLGLDENSLGNSNIHRVDVYKPQDYEPRLPTSDLSGANDKFISGGKTPGGQDECVINQFPNPEQNSNVGKISNVDCNLENNNSNITSKNANISSKNVESTIGGGARAPDGELPDQSNPQPVNPHPNDGEIPPLEVKSSQGNENTIPCGELPEQNDPQPVNPHPNDGEYPPPEVKSPQGNENSIPWGELPNPSEKANATATLNNNPVNNADKSPINPNSIDKGIKL